MTLSFLPKIVELDQLSHRPRPHLLVLDVVEILAIDPETGLEGPALLLGPEGHGIRRRNSVHAFPAERLLHVVSAL